MITFLGRYTNDSTKFGPFLTSLFGLGHKSTKKICIFLGIKYSSNFSSISSEKLLFLQTYLSSFKLESDLKRFVSGRRQDLIKLQSYRGLRLSQGLPSRGQRTKTNAQTAKRLRSK
jgi:small subunit ribosomal protein S13